MALDDEVKKYNKIDQGFTPTIKEVNESRFRNSISDTLNGDVGQITSRDQILDPYSVVDPSEYRQNRRGRAAYQSDLAQAKRLSEQQEAAYQEWYNSPAQVASRERAAGRNPDLTEPIGGEAADTAPAQGSPVDGIPTNGEVASSVVNGIASVISAVSSVGSLVTSFSQLANVGKIGKQLDLQNQNLDLQNRGLLKSAIAGDITDLLATAMQNHLDSDNPGDFDVDAFFDEDSNFSSLEPVYGSNPNFQSILASQRKAVLAHHKNAVELQKDNANYMYDFGMVYTNPRYSPYQKTLLAQLLPVTKMINDAEEATYKFQKIVNDVKSEYASKVDVDAASGSLNSKNLYDSEYYAALQPKLMAGYYAAIQEMEASLATMRNDVYSNLHKNWTSDPKEFFDSGLYLIGEVPNSWQTFGLNYIQNKRSKFRSYLLEKIGIDPLSWDLGIDDETFWNRINEHFQQNLSDYADSTVD